MARESSATRSSPPRGFALSCFDFSTFWRSDVSTFESHYNAEMFLLPIRTEAPVKRLPIVNWLLIGANVLIFFVIDVLGAADKGGWGAQIKQPLMLWPASLELHQFLTFQFLHADWMHLGGNMLFLWLFGNAVNSKMGNATYLMFYLACGVFSGLGFAWGEASLPCLGASGAIAGITTSYLVLFPRSDVTVFYWFFFFGQTQISSLLWILGKMILWDNFLAMRLARQSVDVTSVAYEAHLAGYFIGFVLTCTMLWLRALSRDQYDLLALARRWYQRRTFAAAMQGADAQARAVYGRVARVPGAEQAGDDNVGDVPLASGHPEAWRLRAEAMTRAANKDLAAAASAYQRMIALQADQFLPRTHQQAVANQLMSMGLYPQAAEAYEKYLKHYPRAPDADQVQLMLAILYARDLHRLDQARSLLTQCLARLTDPRKRALASEWLAVVTPAPPPTA